MSYLRQAFTKAFIKILPMPIVTQFNARSYHIFDTVRNTQQTLPSNLLTIPKINIIQTCGFKVKGLVRRRCKDCYFVRRQERLYVICKTHRRHKQMSVVKDERNTWILSHATQGKVRPW